jgi:hypothetical protein
MTFFNTAKTTLLSAVCAGMVLVSFAGPAAALGFTQEDMNSFVEAVGSVRCRVNERTAKRVEERSGLSEEKLRLIAEYLIARKLAKTDDKGFTLINKGCP